MRSGGHRAGDIALYGADRVTEALELSASNSPIIASSSTTRVRGAFIEFPFPTSPYGHRRNRLEKIIMTANRKGRVGNYSCRAKTRRGLTGAASFPSRATRRQNCGGERENRALLKEACAARKQRLVGEA